MLRLVVTLVACLAVVKAAPEAGAMIGCDECVHEMRKMGDIIRHHAPGIEVRTFYSMVNVLKDHGILMSFSILSITNLFPGESSSELLSLSWRGADAGL